MLVEREQMYTVQKFGMSAEKFEYIFNKTKNLAILVKPNIKYLLQPVKNVDAARSFHNY